MASPLLHRPSGLERPLVGRKVQDSKLLPTTATMTGAEGRPQLDRGVPREPVQPLSPADTDRLEALLGAFGLLPEEAELRRRA